MTPFNNKNRLPFEGKFAIKKIRKYQFHVKVSNFKIKFILKNHFMSVHDKACKKRLQNVQLQVFIVSLYIHNLNDNPELNSSYHCTMKCASSMTTALTLSLKEDLRRVRTDNRLIPNKRFCVPIHKFHSVINIQIRKLITFLENFHTHTSFF